MSWFLWQLYLLCAMVISIESVSKSVDAHNHVLVIDDCKFYPEPFAEYLQPAIERLFAAINRVEEMDTKLRILNTISVLLDQVGEMVGEILPLLFIYTHHLMLSQIYPYNRPIMTCLADLWKNSQDYNLMKSAILRALKRLVKVRVGNSNCFYDIEYCNSRSITAR